MAERGQSRMTVALRLCNGGEIEQDGRATAELTFGCNASAMGLDQVFDDGESEAGATFLT